MSKLRKVKSVSCLFILIVVCLYGPITFSEAVKVSEVKRSTAWDCVKALKAEGLIESIKAITPLGPRTILRCSEEGFEALNELKALLK